MEPRRPADQLRLVRDYLVSVMIDFLLFMYSSVNEAEAWSKARSLSVLSYVTCSCHVGQYGDNLHVRDHVIRYMVLRLYPFSLWTMHVRLVKLHRRY